MWFKCIDKTYLYKAFQAIKLSDFYANCVQLEATHIWKAETIADAAMIKCPVININKIYIFKKKI